MRKRSIIILLVVHFLIIISLFLFLNSDYFYHKALKNISEFLVTKYGIKVDCQRLNFSLFPFTMHLDQVKVDYPHIPLSASTKEIEIRIQILPLLFGRANISRVHISQPFLEFSLINPAAKSGKGQESEDEGKQKQQITPEELFEQVAKGLRMALDGRKSLDELPLEIGLVEIRDLGVVLKVKEDTRVAIKNADISLQGLTEQITRVRLTMPRLEIFAGKLTKKISSNIAVKMSENSMVLEEFMIKSDDEKLSLKVLLHRLEKKSASKAEDITLEGKVEVELPLNNINKYSPSIPKMEGRLKTDVEFNGALPNINAKLGLDVNGLSIDEYRVGDIKGDISLNSEKLIINSLEVLAAGGKVNVDGHIDLNRGYNGVLKVKLEKFGLLNLLRNLTVTHNYVDLKVSGLIECNTILPEVLFKGSSQLVVEELEVYPRPIELAGDKNKIVAIKKSEFKFDFDLDPEGINIKNGKIDLMSGQGNIDVKGDVFFTVEKGLNLEAKTQNLMLDNFPILDYQFKGKASAQTLLKGPYLLLNIIGELSVKDFSFQNVDLTSLDLAYTWKGEEEGSMFSFRELKSFSAGGTRLLASGDIDLRQEPLLDIKFLADKLNMEDVIVALPDTVSGKGELRQYIKGSGRAQGSLKIGKDITDIKISADLNALTLATQNYSGGKLAISYKQPILHIHKLSLYEDKKGDANILAKGRVNTSSGNIDLDLGTRNYNLSMLDLPGLPQELKGDLQLTMKIGGKLDAPKTSGNLSIKKAFAGNLSLQDGDLKFKMDKQWLNIQGALFNNFLQVNSRMKLAGKIPWQTNITFSNFPLFPSLAEYLGIKGAKGNLTGAANFSVEIKNPQTAKGEATIFQLRLERDPIFFEAHSFNLQLQGSNLMLPGLKVDSNLGTYFYLKGHYNWQKDVDLFIEGVMQTSMLDFFTDVLEEKEGKLTFNARIHKEIGAGEFQLLGSGKLKSGQFKVDSFPHRFEKMAGDFSFSQGMVMVNSLTGELAGGYFNLQGEIKLDNFIPSRFDLKTQITKCNLHFPEYLPSTVSGFLQVGGNLDKIDLSGSLEVHKAVYSEDVELVSLLMRFLKEQQKKKVFARKKEILNLNLQLRADDNFKILNNMADIEMVGDFIITGTNLQTGIMGNINVLEGELRLADHNYHIDSAFFEFKERYKIYPYFNIQAFTEVEDALNEKKYRVNISINGYPDKYIIDYSADDSLVSKADILMLLTLGMTKKNMEETGNQDSLFDQNSLGMLSKLSGIDSKQILPIPRSRILWNRTFSEETGTFVPQVGIKWSMVPGLDFYYFSSLQDSKEQSLQLEYQINEFTSLNSDWKNINNKTGGGGLGADLKFRWEY